MTATTLKLPRWLMFFMAVWVVQLPVAAQKILPGHVPRVVPRLLTQSRLAPTNQLTLALGLPLRNEAALDELIRQQADPGSPNFHKFLTPPEFAARFGAAESDYLAVQNFARRNGLTILRTHPNRLVLEVQGSAGAVERAFHVSLKTFRHPHESRDFFAPDTEPSVDAALPDLQVSGLDNFDPPQPHVAVRPFPKTVQPHAGSGSGGSYLGNDFRAAYVPGTPLTGNGQNVALVQYDAYYTNDIASYLAAAGISTSAMLTNVPVNGGVATPGSGNVEVALDIEMVLAMAPGVAKIVVYEGPNGSTAWSTMLSTIANDTVNFARQISCSWGATTPGRRDSTSENIFKQMSAQGQSFFNASGDSDAFTNGIPFPSESTNITQVGGTTLSTAAAGGPWTSETVWNRNNGVGSSGGVSLNYGVPAWQQGLNLTAAHGSTTRRNVPDVALTGESVFIYYNNGTAAIAGGTSCAAPLWAGLLALVNEQAVAQGQSAPGFINPAIYAIGKSSVYTNCFHDTVTGNNFNTTSLTNFPAVTGFDLCTGWGTPTGTNLINALLAPPPTFTAQPASRLATNGAMFTLTGTATSALPLGYFWLFNGTNLPAGGNLSGVTSNTLTITAATTNNSGSYQLIASNLTGFAVSTAAVVSVGFVPVVVAPPTNLTLLLGSSASFSVTASGTTTLAYQWRKNGTNFAGAGIVGTNTSTLTLGSITTNSAANYTVIVTNLFGASTSAVAVLTVVLPPSLANSSLTNRTLECGSNISYSLTASGTAPLTIQWSLDGSPVAGATNATFTLTNVHPPSHAISLVITNLYASLTSNATLTVQDTFAPVIVSQPASQTNTVGGTAEFGVVATSCTASSFQWFFNGTQLTNQTASSLALTNLAASAAGNYSVSVTSAGGAVTSAAATLTVNLLTASLALSSSANPAGFRDALNFTASLTPTNVTGAIQFYTNGIACAPVPLVAGSAVSAPISNLPRGTNLLLAVYAGDANYLPATNALAQSVTNHPPLVAPAFYPLIAGLDLSLAVADLATNWSDADGDELSIVAIEPSSQGMIITNALPALFYGYFDYVDDQFVCVVSDGFGGTNYQTVNLTVLPQTNATPAITRVVSQSSGLSLQLNGGYGVTYILESTADLIFGSWKPVATNTLDVTGTWQFTDALVPPVAQKFYRLKRVP